MSVRRRTKSVELILNEFDKNEDAISIVHLVNKFKQRMNKTTVYRILDRLESSEVLHSFIDKDGLKRYAKAIKDSSFSKSMNQHPHFICEDCGISTCVPIEILVPSVKNFTVKRVEHLLIGQCKDCHPPKS